MENYRESGKSSGNLFEDVKAELRLCAGLELVCAVAGADCDRKGVNAGLRNEFLNLFGTGVRGFAFGNLNFVLDTCESTEFALNDNAVSVSIFNDLFGQFNVILE